jgi:hypothetical protein
MRKPETEVAVKRSMESPPETMRQLVRRCVDPDFPWRASYDAENPVERILGAGGAFHIPEALQDFALAIEKERSFHIQNAGGDCVPGDMARRG